MRRTIRDAGYQRGWSVMGRYGSVQIQHSWQTPEGKTTFRAVTVPIPWERGHTDKVLKALKTLSGAVAAGKTLDEAAKLVRDPTHQREGVGWDAALANFKQFKVGGGKVSERTFDRNDGRRLGHLLKQIEAKAPENGKAVV